MICRVPTAMVLSAILLCGAGAASAQAKPDRHAGYYYPPPASTEIYKARAKILKTASRAMRIGFIVNLVRFMRERPYPPAYSIFPKGADGEKLIIVSNRAGRLDTIYRARALLATMTSLSRRTSMFRKYKVETLFTFLDLLKLLGFKQLTISDGDKFAHQIRLE